MNSSRKILSLPSTFQCDSISKGFTQNVFFNRHINLVIASIILMHRIECTLHMYGLTWNMPALIETLSTHPMILESSIFRISLLHSHLRHHYPRYTVNPFPSKLFRCNLLSFNSLALSRGIIIFVFLFSIQHNQYVTIDISVHRHEIWWLIMLYLWFRLKKSVFVLLIKIF